MNPSSADALETLCITHVQGRMTPQQLEDMKQSMGNMNPAMMQQAMSQMKNMQPQDWEHAKREASRLTPEEMAQQAKSASATLTAQQTYVYNVSTAANIDACNAENCCKDTISFSPPHIVLSAAYLQVIAPEQRAASCAKVQSYPSAPLARAPFRRHTHAMHHT